MASSLASVRYHLKASSAAASPQLFNKKDGESAQPGSPSMRIVQQAVGNNNMYCHVSCPARRSNLEVEAAC